jgi:hypothetical protein
MPGREENRDMVTITNLFVAGKGANVTPGQARGAVNA